MSTGSIEITDTVEAPVYGDGALSRWCKKALYQARDEVFVRLTIHRLVMAVVMMSSLIAVSRFAPKLIWPAMVAYFLVWSWLIPPIILMLHNTMHRPFIKTPKFLDWAHPFAMSFFYGVPTGYREHHLGIHHYEDNMPADLSSTMRYQRDSFLHFLVYFGRFFFLSIVEVPLYLHRHKRRSLARRALFGEIVHLSLIATAMYADWHFGLVAMVVPYVSCRFMMMAGNWGQHAFINTTRKNDGISNSVTCINSPYNKRCFNDGYHIGHHLMAARHWTELPGDFVKNRELYASEDAIVFEKLDFFMVSVNLWLGRYETLAKHFVRLDGVPRDDAEVIAMLKERVKPIREAWPTLAET
ncbi:MAG: fatty acid desaturase [Polyangiaceae bacterium]